MLLLCIGPDTFRAQQKARELEEAFKQKHDPHGSSVERVSVGKDGVDEVIQKANTLSLFTPRRFLRATDLLTECPKTKQQILAQALTRDPENVIVVSVESEPLSITMEKAFGSIPKIIKYEFPQQHGPAFRRWIAEMAMRLSVTDLSALDRIMEATDGDSWWAWNELKKLSAYGENAIQSLSPTPTIYEYAEGYLRENSSWTRVFIDRDATPQVLTSFLSQARSALRVRDGATEGLHPYVVQKMRHLKMDQAENKLGHSLAALFTQRAGYGVDEEVMTRL